MTVAGPSTDIGEDLRRDGFAVVPLLDGAEVAAARAAYAATHPDDGQGFAPDFQASTPERKARVAALLKPMFETWAPRVLPDHRVFMAGFLMKWPDDHSELALHQDWSYVDEAVHRTCVLWVALDDADEGLGNGPLEVVPGSHRLVGSNRGVGTPAWYETVWDQLSARLVTVPVRAGDAVLMDNRLLHRSSPNRSGRPRLAVAGALAPNGAPLTHKLYVGDGTVRVVGAVDDDFIDGSPQTMGALVADRPSLGFEPVIRSWNVGGPSVAGVIDVDEDRAAAARAEIPGALGGSQPPAQGGRGATGLLTAALRANHRLVASQVQERSPVVDRRELPWMDRLEAAWPVIRAEWDAASLTAPPMSAVAGVAMPNRGAWGGSVLRDHTGWSDLSARRFPATSAALAAIPGLRAALFSVLDAGAVIDPHRGANNGVLRVHLGLVVPGPPGAASLRVGPEWVPFAEGAGFAFDDTWEHSVANRADAPRVSVMLEVERDLEGWAGLANRAVQALFRLDPQVRGGQRRHAELDAALNG